MYKNIAIFIDFSCHIGIQIEKRTSLVVNLIMPEPRNYGWELKPTSSTHFNIRKRDNGQFFCVLNHALLRGVTSEMIFWWFRHFQNMQVTLDDIANYEGKKVPAYLLWHPSDHVNATLKGKIGPKFLAEAGDTIHIQEAMQYNKYGWKYGVDKELKVFYCGQDGWAMGKKLPILGEAMVLRIHFKDVKEGENIIGVHYHYEVVIGLSGQDLVSKCINRKLTKQASTTFFEAWHLHNTIEVGTFENFLPVLFAQRANMTSLHYSKDMSPPLPSPVTQKGYSEALFNERLCGYENADNLYQFMAYEQPSFL